MNGLKYGASLDSTKLDLESGFVCSAGLGTVKELN